jgi:transposase-like protein
MKYSYEKKLEVAKSVLLGQESLRSAARNLGTDHKLVRGWVARFNYHGAGGLRAKRGGYSGEFKLSVIRYMGENHLSLFETAVKFGIPDERTVSRWYHTYQAEGPSGLFRNNRGAMKKKDGKAVLFGTEAGEKALHKELERLRAENAYLKKLRALVEARIARERGSVHKPSGN